MTEGKILVIGAGGYLGAHLSLYLARQNYQVTAFCHHPRNDVQEWNSAMAQILYGDITSPETRQKLAKDAYDYVIYLISLNHFDSEQAPEPVCQTNVLPLWEMTTLMKGKVKKFVYFSTQQVYGRPATDIISEDLIPQPVNHYGLTHLLCEDIIRYQNQQSATRFINVRLSNGYGAPVFQDNNCWWLVINDLCRSAAREKCIRLQSDGSPQRDFIHVQDIARAIALLLHTEESTDTYNLSSGQSYTIGEIALFVQEIYQEITKKQIPVYLPEGKSLVTKPQHRILVDNQRIKSLGFIPQNNIRTGILSIFNVLLFNQ